MWEIICGKTALVMLLKLFAALYNCTAMVRPEFRTDFYRLVSLILQYNQYMRLDDTVEIGGRIFQQYFSSGNVGDDSHTNMSSVCISLKRLGNWKTVV